jgi:hypothetical protein
MRISPLLNVSKNWVIFISLILIVLLDARLSQSAQSNILLGMNFNFDALDTMAACAPGDRAARARGHGFLVRYDNPEVRQAVRQELTAMRGAGFREIRTLVWFGPANRGATTQSSNMFLIEKPEVAARNVARFAEDVLEAGFTRLYLAFSPQATAAPTCRRQQWGDCFDASEIEPAVNFVSQVRAGISGAAAAILSVDLQNEGGLTPIHPPIARSNMSAYLNALVGAYLRQYPSDKTTISVQERNAAERINAVYATYAEAGRRPNFIDFHIYDVRPAEIKHVTAALRTLPQPIPVIIGEFPYGDSDRLTSLATQLHPEVSATPMPVLFWPLHDTSGACGVDTAPPYDLHWMNLHELSSSPKRGKLRNDP